MTAREPAFDSEFVRDISEKVYRARLEQSCKGDTDRMLEKDNDGGVKLRARAHAYDALTRVYLKALEINR